MSAKRLYLGFLIAMIGIPASVQAEDDYGRPGFYLGAGLGFGFERFEDTGGLDIDTGIGFDGWGGYRFTPDFAAELQLEYIDRFDTSFGGVDIDGRVLTFTGNLKAYLRGSFEAESGPVQPFVVVGIGFLRAELEALGISVSDIDFAGRVGGGVDLYASPNVSLGVTASYVATDEFAYVSLVLGFQYRF